jgi:hypothetical protein
VAVVSAALSLAVTLGTGMTSDQAGAWTAVISGAFAVVTAVVTRPIAPAAFTGLVAVVADLLGAYHYNVSAGTIAAINTGVLAVLALLTRGQVSPVPTLTKPTLAPAQEATARRGV